MYRNRKIAGFTAREAKITALGVAFCAATLLTKETPDLQELPALNIPENSAVMYRADLDDISVVLHHNAETGYYEVYTHDIEKDGISREVTNAAKVRSVLTPPAGTKISPHNKEGCPEEAVMFKYCQAGLWTKLEGEQAQSIINEAFTKFNVMTKSDDHRDMAMLPNVFVPFDGNKAFVEISGSELPRSLYEMPSVSTDNYTLYGGLIERYSQDILEGTSNGRDIVGNMLAKAVLAPK